MRDLRLALGERDDPSVEGRDVLQALLSPKGRRLARLDPHLRGLAIQERLSTVPPGGLVAAPGRRDGDDRQDDDLDDLCDLPGTFALLLLDAAFAEAVRRLDVHVLGHQRVPAVGDNAVTRSRPSGAWSAARRPAAPAPPDRDAS